MTVKSRRSMRRTSFASLGKKVRLLVWLAVGSLLTALGHATVAIDPSSPSVFYLNRGSFLRSDDSGKTWNVKSAGLPPRDIRSILAIGVPTTVYAAIDLGIYRSTDKGESWAAANVGLGDLDVRDVTGSRSSPNFLYATTASGLYRSSDGGATWTITIGLPGVPSVVEADPTNGSIVYAGVSNVLYRSSDSGGTWVKTGTALPIATAAIITAVAVDPNDPSTLLITENSLLSDPIRHILASESRLFVSRDRGNTSSRVPTPLDGPGGSSTVRFDLSSVAYIASGYSQISTSSNHGDSWSPVQAVPASAFAVSSSSPDVLAQGDRSMVSVLSLSEDHGLTWTTLPPLPPCLGLREQLCLANGRFLVSLTAYIGQNAIRAQAVPLTADAGAFWFFSENNIELVMKIVDGRPVNNHYWLFVASLTDVYFILTVGDTATNETKSVIGYQGEMRSFADLSFAGPPPTGEASQRK